MKRPESANQQNSSLNSTAFCLWNIQVIMMILFNLLHILHICFHVRSEIHALYNL